MPVGKFSLRDLWPFGQKPEVAPVAAPANMMSDVVYSESLFYAGEWPKYNPDDLFTAKGPAVYRKMMMDDQVKAVVRFKRDAVTARQWYFDTKPKERPEETDVNGQQPAAQPDAAPTDTGIPVPEPPAGGKGAPIKASRARFDATPPMPPQAAGAGGPPSDPATPPGAVGDVEVEEPKDPEQIELERRAYILEASFEQMEGSVLDALNGIMTSMYHGFSMTEKVFKDIEVDGKTWIGIKRLRPKPFHSFKFYVDEFGNVEKVVQRWENKTEVPIPYEKFIHHVHNPEFDQHYGSSELRDCYRAWFSKDAMWRMMNIYLERMGAGFVYFQTKDGAQAPDNATAAKVQQILSTISAKTGILVPAGLEMMISYPSPTDAYERAIALYDKAIAKALLVPNLLGITEQGDTGSYSQSQTQLEAFLWTLDAEASRLEETINEQLIKPLCDLNFGEGGPYPLFKFEPISDTIKMNVIKLWNEMVKAGSVKPTDADSDHLRQLLDFPEAGEPLSTPPPAIVPGQPGTAPAPGSPDSSASPADPSKPVKGNPAAPAAQPPKPDETIVGKGGQMKSAREEAFTRAQRRVSFAVIDNKAQQITAAGTLRLDKTLREAVSVLLAQVRDEKMHENPEAIRDLKIPARVMTRVRAGVDDALKSAWQLGVEHATREMERAQEKRFSAADSALADAAAEKFLESRAFQIAGDLSDSARKTIVTTIYNGIKGEWDLQEIEDRIDELLGSDVYPHVGTAVRTSVFDAINQARWETFTDPQLGGFVEAFEFAAVLDGRTTEVCEHMNGKVYPTDSPVWDTYDPPLHFNCRSILVAVTMRDSWKESNPPDDKIQPADGFGGA